MRLLYYLLVLFCTTPVCVLAYGTNYGVCERITIPMCMEMKYNMTHMPNLVGHNNQKDAALGVHEFIPLVQVRCSPLLKFFLCSMYAPMCTKQVDETLVIPPCRSMCVEVKSKCEPILVKFNFRWPQMLDCESLPETSDRTNLCMEAPRFGEHPEGGDEETHLYKSGMIPGDFTQSPELQKLLEALKGKNTSPATPASTNPPLPTCPDRYVYVEKENTNNSCSPMCNVDVYFRQEDKNFAEIWMMVWSVLCLISTTLTVSTFIIDTSRFKYPERPIIFLAVCYAFYSLAYIIRGIVGPNIISCDRVTHNGHTTEFLIEEGLESTWCIIIFLIQYFFGMASCIWWVILTLTWFLAAGRKWGQEAIEAMGSYFHLAAWAVPAVKTIVILIMRRVDGDELTGLCYVGNQDRAALTGFVLGPLIAYLLIGTIFILAGFLALFKIRHNLKQDGTNIRKLEKLMAKIGIFSVLYTVPATCVIGCYFYEQLNVDQWKQMAQSTECQVIRIGPRAGQTDCSLPHSFPAVEVYMLKIFMSVVVGITTGMWICSSKTLSSWSNFFSKTCLGRRKSHVPTYQQNTSGRKQIHYQKCTTKPPLVPSTPSTLAPSASRV